MEIAKSQNIKCIIFTGHYNNSFINKAQSIGVVAFISKMGKIDDLKYACETMNRLLYEVDLNRQQ